MGDLLKSLEDIFFNDSNKKYIIPFYQRNFSWRDSEIKQLIDDIYANKDKDGNYFIGTLVTIKHKNNPNYDEVIDGQQRLTALTLIIKYLFQDDKNLELKLEYQARTNVKEFLTKYYENINIKPEDIEIKEFSEAIESISSWQFIGDGKKIDDLRADQNFKNYLLKNVKIVHEEMPEDTDVESYFEIMNNRGEQLKSQDIIKARIIEKTSKDKQNNAGIIWQACSQMNENIQKIFNNDFRKKLFTNNFNKICSFDKFLEILSKEEILLSDTNDEAEDSEVGESIIDFPNFLMHLFKIYNSEVPLNDKDMLSIDLKKIFKIKTAEELLYHLFSCRVFFDRYIVILNSSDSDDEEKTKWVLQKPAKNSEGYIYFVHTFSDNYEDIKKALSMLQVYYRTKIYKDWLNHILKEYTSIDKVFSQNNFLDINEKDYLVFLDEYIIECYNKLGLSKEILKTYNKGVQTHRFLFSFIDYLYYRSKKVTDFEFKYYNSIEHHYSQNYAYTTNNKEIESVINYLGNLLITTRKQNSRLSDRPPIQKIDYNKNDDLPPKQRIMYDITKNNGWGKEEILSHNEDVVDLLSKAYSILNIKNKG